MVEAMLCCSPMPSSYVRTCARLNSAAMVHHVAYMPRPLCTIPAHADAKTQMRRNRFVDARSCFNVRRRNRFCVIRLCFRPKNTFMIFSRLQNLQEEVSFAQNMWTCMGENELSCCANLHEKETNWLNFLSSWCQLTDDCTHQWQVWCQGRDFRPSSFACLTTGNRKIFQCKCTGWEMSARAAQMPQEGSVGPKLSSSLTNTTEKKCGQFSQNFAHSRLTNQRQ